MEISPSDLGPLLIGIVPVIVCLVALIFVAGFIRRRSEKKARRRFRRHGYTGYISYNPTADPTYLNPPLLDEPLPDSKSNSKSAHHHHDGATSIRTDAGSHH